MIKTFEMFIPVSYDDGLPEEVTITDINDNVRIFKVHGWRRESGAMMTVFVTEKI